MTESVIVSCEHARNRIPAEFSSLFTGYEALLTSHHAWDPGALIFAGDLAAKLNAPLFFPEYSRLLVDLNRSRHHRALLSSMTRACLPAIRDQIIAEYYLPYRLRVETAIARALDRSGKAWHMSVHSFTPVLDGKVRNADLGILYDPSRSAEREFAHDLRAQLAQTAPLRIRMNYPYRGTADGFTTFLRRRFGMRYVGIEIELNQAFAAAEPSEWLALRHQLISAICESLCRRVDQRA